MKIFESWMLSYLLNSLWQIPLLLTAGWVASRVLKSAGASTQHRIWVTVLLMQVLLPAFATLPLNRTKAIFAWIGNWVGALVGNWIGGPQPGAEAGVSVAMGAGTGAGIVQLPPMLLSAVALAYGAITAYFLARFAFRVRALSAMRREAAPLALTGEAAPAWAQCAQKYGVEASLAISSRIFGPVAMGITRKLVLLPEEMAAQLPAIDIRTIIAHEFAHLYRKDFLKNLIYELLSLPISYHPLFRFTKQQIMESREMVCDEMAAQLAGREQYARSLLRLASLLVKGVPVVAPHAIGIFDASPFERRLMRLTGNQNDIQGVRRLVLLAACSAFGIGICGSALALSVHVDAASSATEQNESKTPGPVAVPAEVMAGQILRKVQPVYPVEAKKARIQGKVVLDAVIGKDGAIRDLQAASGPSELQQSSLVAVRQWVYKPFLRNGTPVEVKTTINVFYTLQK